jgi:hypothetical protein
MIDQGTSSPSREESDAGGARQRALDAYEGARDRATDTLGQAPLLALAGGLAAGALIAALLPRTDAEAKAVGPTARRIRDNAQAAARAARDTGSQRLGDLGLSRDKAEETVRNLLNGLADAAKASADAALDVVRNPDDS